MSTANGPSRYQNPHKKKFFIDISKLGKHNRLIIILSFRMVISGRYDNGSCNDTQLITTRISMWFNVTRPTRSPRDPNEHVIATPSTFNTLVAPSREVKRIRQYNDNCANVCVSTLEGGTRLVHNDTMSTNQHVNMSTNLDYQYTDYCILCNETCIDKC